MFSNYSEVPEGKEQIDCADPQDFKKVYDATMQLLFKVSYRIVNDEEAASGVVSIMVVGLVMLATGILSLLEGIFSLQAAKNAAKAGPLWVISLVSVIGSVASMLLNIVSGGSFTSGLLSLLINCFIFYLANNIKKHA